MTHEIERLVETVRHFIDLPFQDRWGDVERDAEDALTRLAHICETQREALEKADAALSLLDRTSSIDPGLKRSAGLRRRHARDAARAALALTDGEAEATQ